MSTAHQKQVARYFPNKSVWYSPGLAIALGSPEQGILISQLLFWHDKGKRKDGLIYKTIEEMRLETGLSRTQQDTAIRKCVELQILEVKLKGIPAKRHFYLNYDALINLLPSLKKTRKLDYPNPPNIAVRNAQRITEITQETTTKNTQISEGNNKNHISEIIKKRYPYINRKV